MKPLDHNNANVSGAARIRNGVGRWESMGGVTML
jgi:hypothetical protein